MRADVASSGILGTCQVMPATSRNPAVGFGTGPVVVVTVAQLLPLPPGVAPTTPDVAEVNV